MAGYEPTPRSLDSSSRILVRIPTNITLKSVNQHFTLHLVSLSLSLSNFAVLLFLHLGRYRIYNYFLGILCFNTLVTFFSCLCPRPLIAKVFRTDIFHIMKLLTYITIFYLTKLICPCKLCVGKCAPRMYQEPHL